LLFSYSCSLIGFASFLINAVMTSSNKSIKEKLTFLVDNNLMKNGNAIIDLSLDNNPKLKQLRSW